MSKTTKHTVTTLLSSDGVASVEIFFDWFFEYFDSENITGRLMQILSVYVQYCPKDCACGDQPQYATRFVSELIQVCEQLREIMIKEKAWEWDDTEIGRCGKTEPTDTADEDADEPGANESQTEPPKNAQYWLDKYLETTLKLAESCETIANLDRQLSETTTKSLK